MSEKTFQARNYMITIFHVTLKGFLLNLILENQSGLYLVHTIHQINSMNIILEKCQTRWTYIYQDMIIFY